VDTELAKLLAAWTYSGNKHATHALADRLAELPRELLAGLLADFLIAIQSTDTLGSDYVKAAVDATTAMQAVSSAPQALAEQPTPPDEDANFPP